MKKLLIFLFGITLVAGLAGSLYAETSSSDKKPTFAERQKIQEKSGIKMQEVMTIRKQMREMERATIQKDEELKKIAEEIRALTQELKEKLNVKLADNQEYQKLKESLEKIKGEWQEKRKEFKKNREGRRKPQE